MNGFELKEVLEQYTDEELQAMRIVFVSNIDIELEDGDAIRINEIEVNDFNELILTM